MSYAKYLMLACKHSQFPSHGVGTSPSDTTVNFIKYQGWNRINAVKGARPGSTIPYKADMGLSVDVPAWGPLRLPMSREGQLSIPSAPGLLDHLRDMVK